MNTALRPFFLLVLVAVGVIGVSYYLKPSGKEIIPWRTNYDTAQAEAAKSNRPLLLYFTATWCGPCQSMRNTTWTSRSVESALAGYVPVKLDVDQYPALAKRYQIHAIPHFFVIDGTGKTTKETDGAMGPDDFVNWINEK